MTTFSSEELELRAADERRRMHDSIVDLKAQVENTLNWDRMLRNHTPLIAGTVGLAAISMGYLFTGIFTRH